MFIYNHHFQKMKFAVVETHGRRSKSINNSEHTMIYKSEIKYNNEIRLNPYRARFTFYQKK